MVDLHGQYLKIKEEVDAAIQGVIDSTAFIRGGDVRLFQGELSSYMGTAYTVACGNGTDALQVAMMALDLEPAIAAGASPDAIDGYDALWRALEDAHLAGSRRSGLRVCVFVGGRRSDYASRRLAELDQVVQRLVHGAL